MRRYGVALMAYLLATWLTDAHFMGDTVGYVNTILTGGSKIWEFGHLLWRPLGWLASVALRPLTRLAVGDDVRANLTFTLVALGWLAGLMSALLFRGLVSRVCRHEWACNVATIAFIFAQGALNYSQTGCSYVPGLSFLLLGFCILAGDGEQPERSLRSALFAGMALAGAICMWFLYLWAIPAAICVPLFLYGFSRERLRLVIRTALVFGVAVGLIYASVLAGLGIYSVAGVKAWTLSASHGATVAGFPRMVFGFARSFINMGNDGLLIKRFLLHDPYNPVSLPELFRLSLWKLILFYLLLASIIINLVRSREGKRMLCLLMINAIPVTAFAVFWQGGDMERYLGLYPLIFLSLAFVLCCDRSPLWSRLVVLVFVAAMIGSNGLAMSKPSLQRRQEMVEARISALVPLLKPQSRVVTVNQRDELWESNYDFPFNPIFRNYANLTYPATVLGTSQVLRWRQELADMALSVWEDGADVWVSKRALSPRPRKEWLWAEGDDARVPWNDLYSFFTQLETGETVGGEDGFVLLPPTPGNRQLLSIHAQPKQP